MSQNIIFTNQNSKEISSNLTPEIEKLITKYQESLIKKLEGNVSFIHVDEIASKIAAFYEKVRMIVDWKDENILRRSAIERILKRVLIGEISQINHSKEKEIAEPLVKELIRGGHLPNDAISQVKIILVEKILHKYLYLLKNAPYSQSSSVLPLKKKVNFYNWLLEIAACEIEEVLAPPLKENALIEAMTNLLNERIKITPSEVIEEKEKLTQTYIAVHRTLFDLDNAIITYRLLKYFYPQWENPDEVFLQNFNQNIFKIWERLEKQLNHPLRKDFFNICERIDTVFLILGDILESFRKHPEKIKQNIANKETLKELITKFYNKRLRTLKSRLFRLAVFSSLSVFLSNFFTYFIVEVPLANLFYEGFSFFAALVDFLIPTLVMFILVSMIRPPKEENLNKVIETTFSFVYPEGEKNIYEIKIEKKRNILVRFIIGFLYFSAGIFTLSFIAYLFWKAKIPLTSVILDTAMISLNVFAALIIRNKAKELTVEEKTTIWEFILDTLAVPVAKIGSFLANKWREYNIVSVFLNVFVEMPFVAIIEFIESWSQFIKERKAEIH